MTHAGVLVPTAPGTVRCGQGVPREVALEAASAMPAAGSDAVIAIGGGSSVETAKAALVANADSVTSRETGEPAW